MDPGAFDDVARVLKLGVIGLLVLAVLAGMGIAWAIGWLA